MNVKGKKSKIFHTEITKTNDLSKKEFKRKKGKYSRIVCLTLPLQTRKKLYKIITIPSVKKVIEKDLKLTISKKSLKNIEKKLKLLYTNQQH